MNECICSDFEVKIANFAVVNRGEPIPISESLFDMCYFRPPKPAYFVLGDAIEHCFDLALEDRDSKTLQKTKLLNTLKMRLRAQSFPSPLKAPGIPQEELNSNGAQLLALYAEEYLQNLGGPIILISDMLPQNEWDHLSIEDRPRKESALECFAKLPLPNEFLDSIDTLFNELRLQAERAKTEFDNKMTELGVDTLPEAFAELWRTFALNPDSLISRVQLCLSEIVFRRFDLFEHQRACKTSPSPDGKVVRLAKTEVKFPPCQSFNKESPTELEKIRCKHYKNANRRAVILSKQKPEISYPELIEDETIKTSCREMSRELKGKNASRIPKQFPREVFFDFDTGKPLYMQSNVKPGLRG